jgi:EmrB/QacA subfamily drug resistance transporter
MKRFEYKYVVAAVFVIGLFMDLLDMTITNVALPTLAVDFRASATAIEWVVTGYLLSLAVFIPVSGWAGDRFGTKRTFMFALTMFTFSSLMCGLSWSIESLVFFRVLQGVGGGMLTPVGTAMLFRAFPPHERAKASSVLTIPAVIAPASGPVLGGYLVEYQTWRWIFLVNIPVGILGLLVCGLLLREHREERPGRLDLPGFLLSAFGLATVVYALAQAGERGWTDPRVLLFGFAGLAALVAFVAVELRVAEPMLDIRLFRDRLFSASNTVQFVSQAGLGGALFLLPLLLQAEMGLSPLQSGLTTFPQAIGVTLMAPIIGRFVYPRVGPRRLVMAGLLFVTLITLAFVWVDLGTSQWTIRGIMLLRGMSFAIVFIPMQTATFATIKSEDTGRASAAFNSIRQIGASFGVALLATILTSRLMAHGAMLGNPATRTSAVIAFHDAFIGAALLTVVGIAAALLISDKLAAGTMRQIAAEGEEEPASVAVH